MKHASKRIIAMLIAVVMILGILPLASAANVGPFTDVQDSEWYADYVEYVYDNDLMNGMSDETFEPNSTCTRAMAATVLYRIDGENEVDEEASFDDLTAAWYKDAVAWAEYEGVVKGVDEGKFNPDGLVTREQLVTMIWRYAGEETPDDDEGIDEFEDADDVSEYAIDAFNWGIENGIINGKGDILDPAGDATRAEFAKIISIYDELREEEEDPSEEDPSEEDPSEEDPSEEDPSENPSENPSEDPSEDPSTPGEDPEEAYIAIYNDAKGKAMTTDSSEYTSSTSGITKKQLGSADATLNADGKLETSATNIALFKMETVDGITSFITPDGKYLSCDGTDLAIVDAASDNTEFILDEADGGNYIRLANFLYNGSSAQYIEFYANVFTCFGMLADSDPAIYTFTFREVVGAETPDDPSDDPSTPSSDAFVLSSTIKAGDEVIIVCAAKNIAFSSDKSNEGSYYNGGVEVAPVDGKITNAPAAIVWTVGEKDGYYTFSFDGKNIGLGEDFGSTNYDQPYDTWAIEAALTEGASYIKNVGRNVYLEWYEEKIYFSCYYNNSVEELFAMNFYVKGATPSEPGETPSEPTPSEEPTAPSIPTDGYVAIYNDANGKVMTSEVSEYTSSSSGITKKQLVSAAASLSAEGNLITDATNVPLFKVETVDGVTSFVTEDGKYLACDGTNLEIVDAASENTEFVLEETEGGYFIRLANFLYQGSKAQYIEFYRDVFTCFGMGTDTSIYTFTFRAIAAEGEEPSEAPTTPSEEDPSEEPTTPPAPPADGYVAIYNDANGKVMTSEVSEYTSSSTGITKKQLVSAAASLSAEGNLITDATNVLLFKVETYGTGVTSFVTEDGKYLSCDGTNLEIVDAASENTEFVLEETEGGYFIRLANFLYQGSKAQYIEFYRDVFTCFGMGTDTSIYTFTFRAIAAEGEEPTEATPETPTEPTTPPAPVEGAAPVNFADLMDGDVIAIVVRTSPEMTNKDFVMLNNFGADAFSNAAEFGGTFDSTMTWTVKIVNGQVYLYCGENVGLYAINNNNGLRADGEAAAITMSAEDYLSLSDPDGNVRYIGVYDNNMGDMSVVSSPNFRCYKNTTNNTKNQTTTIYKIG